MKFQDIFVPRWQHSNPEVRIKALQRIKDKSLITVREYEFSIVRRVLEFGNNYSLNSNT